MIEYVIALCAILALATAIGYLVQAEKSSADRTQTLVGGDWP